MTNDRLFGQIYGEIESIKARLDETKESLAFQHTGSGIPTHSASEGVFYWDYTNDQLYVNSDGSTTWQSIGGGGGAVSHNMLSATHLDSTAASVARGSLISGQGASPTWTRLDHPSDLNNYLRSNASEPGWTGDITLNNGAFAGIDGGGRLVFDSTASPDQVEVTDGDLVIATSGRGVIHVDGNTAGWVLLGDGTRFVPAAMPAGVGNAPDSAQYVVLALDAGLSAERVLTSGNGLAALADTGANGTVTVAMGTPSTLTVATANGLTATSHTHAITSSSNPGAAASILATDANGYITLEDMYIDEYIWHTGDTNTYLRFQADNITLRAGGADLLDLVEAGTNYVLFGAQADLNGNLLILDADGDTYLHDSADDHAQLVIANNAQYTFNATQLTVSATGGADTVRIRASGDLTSAADIWLDGDGGISAESSLTMLIDSNNNSTTARFEIAKDADTRETDTSGTPLWAVFEDSTVIQRLSGIAHGATAVFKHTDVFAQIEDVDAGGGMMISGGKDSGGTNAGALVARGFLGENADTTKTTSGIGIIRMQAYQITGTGGGNVVANGNLLTIETLRSGSADTVFIFDVEGSAHADVEWTTFDDHDDLALLNSLEAAFGQFAEQNKQELETLGIARFDDRPGHAMVNWTRLSMLLTGAIRQNRARIDKGFAALGIGSALLEA